MSLTNSENGVSAVEMFGVTVLDIWCDPLDKGRPFSKLHSTQDNR
jgi:hypothetical protein